MDYILKNGFVYMGTEFVKSDLMISGGKVSFSVPFDYEKNHIGGNVDVINCLNKYIFPGFADVHVHLREPGFSYKETIKTGSEAGASSGYTVIMPMPNLNPVPDSLENLKVEQDIISRDAVINVFPYASITKGQKGETLSDMKKLSEKVLAFSDDGVGVQMDGIMEKAMTESTKYDKLIVAHCEDNTLLNGGYIHDGEYCRIHNHKGISSASEYKQVERDIKLAKKTGAKYHICHVSTSESVEFIRKGKKDGVNVTAETAPHYLVFNDMMLKEDGAFKMNPPIRSERDRQALLNGIKDGTIDMIATDHAPHSAEEKSRGLRSVNGIVGLETAFPVLYTKLVKESKEISLVKLIELMSVNPMKRFKIDKFLAEGKQANLTVFDLDNPYEIDSNKFYSMGKCTPFDKWKVYGKCLYNFCNGKLVYENGRIVK